LEGIDLITPKDFDLISKLLDKFSLKYDKEEVEKIIERVCEDASLEEFEQELDSSQKIELGNFENLTGYEFEGYLKGLFNLLGYTVVQTSLSGDQGADLIMSKDGEKVVVQAKKVNDKVSNKAIQEVVAARNHYKAGKAMVVTNSSFTKSAIELSLSNNVDLWDGLKLKSIIQNLRNKKKGKILHSEKLLTLQKSKDLQKITIPCPFCEKEFEYKINIGEGNVKEGINFETKCPHCGIVIQSSAREKCE
jgi:restriction endonuclease Mrr